ncbi:hypothetical protein DFW101_0840 [Solidesulfovibrio carbinoliphilus subsp. oakridgensis]|uniref:Uncharacterized protein n=1 Tax=Solidesulfovibrio carbinoliphilus subsp. oakridgensis TaxID=694327 RepID=G7Q466_9BACT|nr:hypothetical protein [Solidesulfovibrio carbinoliphilus]EHJ46856.1 hypothetical protein DFW101_0840 [Solidesulfovibrio carbinoliphilus subsp. oakridgensis]
MSIDLTTVFQALPYAQNVAHAELVQPQAGLAASQLLAEQVLAEQNKQTPRIEQQDAADTVGDKEQQGRQARDQRQHRPRRPAPPEAEETQASNPTPFAGHIINMKI